MPSKPNTSAVEDLGLRGSNSPDEILCFLSLSSIKGVGFHTLKGLYEKGMSFSEVICQPNEQKVTSELRNQGAKIGMNFEKPWLNLREELLERGLRLRAGLEQAGVELLLQNDPRYPTSLLALKNPPSWLFVQGDVDVLSKPAITVVGTRKPSDDGIWLSRFVGLCLLEWGCPTVSGLALGIDQAIHRASIEAKLPTIAVLGTGILTDYPRNTVSLRDQIIESGGALVTEYLPNESYSAQNFVQRNRLQAALGCVLVPVEWNVKSGTAHTVRFASQMGRPIASLRLPNLESSAMNERTAYKTEKIFTIPGQEMDFRKYIDNALDGSIKTTNIQPKLFS